MSLEHLLNLDNGHVCVCRMNRALLESCQFLPLSLSILYLLHQQQQQQHVVMLFLLAT